MNHNSKHNCQQIEVAKSNIIYYRGRIYYYKHKIHLGMLYQYLVDLNKKDSNLYKYPTLVNVAKKQDAATSMEKRPSEKLMFLKK